MAAAQINGGATKGIYYDMKHFALNEQETHRSIYGVTTWVTEQTIRENYLKAFEITIKNAVTVNDDGSVTHNAKGIMSSFNRIGAVWTGGDYRLLTTVLRNEWGFRGVVICDFNTNPYMNCEQMAFAGGNLNLHTVRPWTAKQTAATTTVLRNNAKDILYVVANSNAMRGEFTVSMPAWQMWMFIVEAIIVAALIVWGVIAIRRALKKEYPAKKD
jgi:beta-glucosidase